MENRLYVAVVASVVLFCIGVWIDYGSNQEDLLKRYAARIEASLHEREGRLQQLLKDTLLTSPSLAKLTFEKQQQYLEKLRLHLNEDFNLIIYDGDTLQLWLNNLAVPDSQLSRELANQGEISRFIKFPNGYYELLKRQLPDGRWAVGLIPLKLEYALKSKYLPDRFIAKGAPIPDSVFFSSKPTPFSIRNGAGKALTWLDARPPLRDRQQLLWAFVFYLLGFVALALVINDLSLLLARKYKPWIGAAFMLLSVIGIRWMTIELDFAGHFTTFQTFQRVFESESLRGMDSLGDLLINILLLVWMMVFFNREFQIKAYSPTYPSVSFLLVLLHVLAVSLGLMMVCKIFRTIIVDSNIVFDFDNVFALDTHSILAILAIIFLLLALFLFSHRMMLAVHNIGLPRVLRYLAIGGALLLTLPMLSVGQLGLEPHWFLLGAAIFLLFFDAFVSNRILNLGWLVIWLMLFSAYTAVLLYKYNFDKDIDQRIEMARALAGFQDNEAVQKLAVLIEKLQRPETLEAWQALIDTYHPAPLPKELATEIIKGYFVEDKYLQLNYSYTLTAFYIDSATAAISDQTQPLGLAENEFQNGRPTPVKALRFLDETMPQPGYLIRLLLPVQPRLLLFIQVKRDFSEPSKVYTELLVNQRYKNLDQLERYDYAIYKADALSTRRELIEEYPKAYPRHLTDTPPPPGQYRLLRKDFQRSEIIYTASNHLVIIMGRDGGGIIKALSLFSYVFILLTMSVLLFSGINYYTNALPGPLNFFRNSRPSLRRQFQMWVIAMILLTFLLIGYVTVQYFQKTSDDYLRGRLERNVESAQANVLFELKKHQQQSRQLGQDTSTSTDMLSALVPLLSDVHQLDVNIFDLQGRLLTSSELEIFRKGLVSPYMGSYAWQELHRLHFEKSQQLERIGMLRYLCSYHTIQNLEGRPMAYLGIPYYARKRELASDVTAFMSALLNLYVFLLLMTGGLAIFIANRITSALGELSAKMMKLRLGYNEPIDYKRNDEIGDLVQAYNHAVKKIEESSRLLAQSEREGAWRTMAQQVAHEIGNPITPMRLSIQYLQRAMESGVDNLPELVKRVSQTLLEQIDAISRIVQEFSSFAKMPKAENTMFSINELARSVHTLFASERLDMDISLYLPSKEYIVYADRNNLTRVLNNLFKNAIQAIPTDRKGIIEMRIEQQDNHVLISVSDNGSGIPEEVRDKVFVPNFSTKSTGSGLGLAICKNIVESAGGEIWFESSIGKGTTFFVKLPIVEVRDPLAN